MDFENFHHHIWKGANFHKKRIFLEKNGIFSKKQLKKRVLCGKIGIERYKKE